MRYTHFDIIPAINNFAKQSSKSYYDEFYIGITNDPQRRLAEHNVDPHTGRFVWYEATNKTTAQTVEEYFLSKGMKGDTGGGQLNSTYVYCYEITPYTRQ